MEKIPMKMVELIQCLDIEDAVRMSLVLAAPITIFPVDNSFEYEFIAVIPATKEWTNIDQVISVESLYGHEAHTVSLLILRPRQLLPIKILWFLMVNHGAIGHEN